MSYIIGQNVQVKGIPGVFEIAELPNDRGQILLQKKLLKILVPVEHIILTKFEPTTPKSSIKIRKLKKTQTAEIRSVTVDLHALSVEQAVGKLDKILDEAILNNCNQIHIIHGLGTGKLKEAVRKYLTSSKHVSKMIPDPSNPGVTIAYL